MRRIKKAKITHISLCPKGANRMPVIYKDAQDGQDSVDLELLVKADQIERGEVLAVMYSPELADSQGEIASAEVVKEMAYTFARDGKGVDIRHNETVLSKNDVYVAESFLIQKGDTRFAGMKDTSGNVVDVTGGWGVVLKIESEEIKALYRSGEWAGVSMGGVAYRQVEKQDLSEQFLSVLREKLGLKKTPINGSDDMILSELETALAKQSESLTKAIVEAMKPAAPAAKDESKFDMPVFKGEYTAENVARHSLVVRKHVALKGLDWSNAEAVVKAQTELAAIEAEEVKLTKTDSAQDENLSAADTAAGVAKEDNDEVKGLKRKLFKAQGKTNQPGDGEAPAGSTLTATGILTKEDVADFGAGQKMAKAWNESRGGK